MKIVREYLIFTSRLDVTYAIIISLNYLHYAKAVCYDCRVPLKRFEYFTEVLKKFIIFYWLN